jgi:hypothetical protein
MAQNHGARQQKRAAKQKAKRSEKRAKELRRNSTDPTIRLATARKWPVVQAIAASNLWTGGLGSLAIARRESEGQLVFAVFLVDVYCLGVKNAFWQAGSSHDFKELIERTEKTQPIRAMEPACLVKILTGAVAYAQSFGFPPHPDYRHAAMLLDGIDPEACPQQFTYGHNGKPFYVQGPHESSAQAAAIRQRIAEAGGHFIVGGPLADFRNPTEFDDELDHDDADELDHDSSLDERS